MSKKNLKQLTISMPKSSPSEFHVADHLNLFGSRTQRGDYQSVKPRARFSQNVSSPQIQAGNGSNARAAELMEQLNRTYKEKMAVELENKRLLEENAELQAKLYLIMTEIDSYKERLAKAISSVQSSKISALAQENEELKARIKQLEESFKSIRASSVHPEPFLSPHNGNVFSHQSHSKASDLSQRNPERGWEDNAKPERSESEAKQIISKLSSEKSDLLAQIAKMQSGIIILKDHIQAQQETSSQRIKQETEKYARREKEMEEALELKKEELLNLKKDMMRIQREKEEVRDELQRALNKKSAEAEELAQSVDNIKRVKKEVERISDEASAVINQLRIENQNLRNEIAEMQGELKRKEHEIEHKNSETERKTREASQQGRDTDRVEFNSELVSQIEKREARLREKLIEMKRASALSDSERLIMERQIMELKRIILEYEEAMRADENEKSSIVKAFEMISEDGRRGGEEGNETIIRMKYENQRLRNEMKSLHEVNFANKQELAELYKAFEESKKKESNQCLGENRREGESKGGNTAIKREEGEASREMSMIEPMKTEIQNL